MADRPVQLSQDTLDLLQRVLNVKLPRPYRDFMQQTNGARPERTRFEFPRSGGELQQSRLHHVFGVNSVNSYDDLWVNYLRNRDRFGRYYLQIADDPGGNAILLAVSGPTYGKVFFMDHEGLGNPSEDGPEMLNLIANSFQEFLDGLEGDQSSE